MDIIGKPQVAPPKHFHEAGETNPKHENELLDEGLEETFPASDPAAVSITRVTEDTEGTDDPAPGPARP